MRQAGRLDRPRLRRARRHPETTEKFLAGDVGWPEWRYDTLNTATSPAAFAIDPGNVGDLAERWSAPLGSPGSAVVLNGILYVASQGTSPSQGKLVAYPAECEIAGRTCTDPLWSADIAGDVSRSTPSAFPDGRVYLAARIPGAGGSTTGRLFAFDAATGALQFTGDTAGPIDAPPHVTSAAFVASDDGHVYLFTGCGSSGASCPPVWKSPGSILTGGGGAVTSSPAGPVVTSGGVVLFVGSPNGYLYALDVSTGAGRWVGPTGGAIHSSPAVANDAVYVGSDNGTLRAFYTGGCPGKFLCKPLWTFNAGAPITASPALERRERSHLRVRGLLERQEALRAQRDVRGVSGGGQLLWTGSTGGAITGSPVVAGGLVYVPSHDGAAVRVPGRRMRVRDVPAAVQDRGGENALYCGSGQWGGVLHRPGDRRREAPRLRARLSARPVTRPARRRSAGSSRRRSPPR